MSGYRRFIAYVYEYQKGKKSTSCGFVKVEVREQRCTIEVHLHCPGISPDIPCTVYGFIRKDGLINGIRLADCETETDTVECLIETDSHNMNDSGFALGKMGGMILITQTGLFFGTEWDDQNIRPDNFHELQTPPAASSSPVSNTSEIPMPSASSTSETSAPPVSGTPETSAPPVSNAHETSVSPVLNASNRNSDSGSLDISASPSTPDSDVSSLAKPDPPLKKQSTDSPASESVFKSESAFAPFSDPVSQPSDADQPSKMPEEKTVHNNPALSADKNIENASDPTNISDTANNSNTTKNSDTVRNFELPFGEKFFPFNDGEFVSVWKIQPRDFLYFPMQSNALRNNRFLQYGFYNFGHLLLGLHSNGQYILGIPGGYSQQERFMANMFGFPYFKESSYIQLPGIRGGYWYRSVNAPDLNHGHRSQ